MNIPRIQIAQQFARIRIERTPPVLEIKQNRADLKIKQPRGRLKIEQKEAAVEIDNYPFRRDLGYKNFADFNREVVRRAEETAREAAARYARQGDRLMRIYKKGSKKGGALLENIRENITPVKRELGLKWLRGPEFRFAPGRLEVEYLPRKPEIESRVNPPEYRFHRGKIKIQQACYGEIEITFKGQLLSKIV